MYNRNWGWGQYSHDNASPECHNYDEEQVFVEQYDERETRIRKKLAKLVLADDKAAELIIKLLSHGLDIDLKEANQLAIKLDLEELDFFVIDNDFEGFSQKCTVPELRYGDY